MDWVPVWLLLFKGGVLFTGMFYAIKWHYDQDRDARNGATGAQWGRDMRLFAAMLVAGTLSLAGIVYAGCFGRAAQGGWGGALALGLMLVVFAVSKPAAGADPGGRLEPARRIAAFRPDNLYFGLGALTAALAWKFGAVAAGWFAFLR